MMFFSAALLFLVSFKLLRTRLLKLVGVCSTAVTSNDESILLINQRFNFGAGQAFLPVLGKIVAKYLAMSVVSGLFLLSPLEHGALQVCVCSHLYKLLSLKKAPLTSVLSLFRSKLVNTK